MTIEAYDVNSKTAGLWSAVLLDQFDRLTRAGRDSGANSGTGNKNMEI